MYALTAVSFFTDVSSEMIYPLLPAFLTLTLGASASFIGAIEGAARAVREMRPVVVDGPAELALFGAGAAAFVPLRIGPAGVSLLVLLHRRPGHFGTVEPHVLEALAIAADHALERAGEGRTGLAAAQLRPPAG